MKLRISIGVLIALFSMFFAPYNTFVLAKPLNGPFPTFQNDSNIVISSSNNMYFIGWKGTLPLSRGGTGASSFTAGSIVFSKGSSLTQDNAHLFWDDTNNRLGIGTKQPTTALDVVGTIQAHTIKSTLGNIISVDGFDTGPSGGVNFQAGDGQLSSLSTAEFSKFIFSGGTDAYHASAQTFNFSGHTSDNTFIFPNTSGTLSLLETNQTWTGLNKFEANTNSTIYVGSASKSGCIALGDSDGSGMTYITANDGAITASAIKPSFCE